MADATPSSPGAPYSNSPAALFESKLTEQFRQRGEQSQWTEQSNSNPENNNLLQPPRSSPKSRSLSDAPRHEPSSQPPLPGLSQSTKDDLSLASTSNPGTPQKSHALLRGLSLHLPSKPCPNSESSLVINHAPLSPKLDVYGSPASVLPRRSRGLDFSRACTSLHHSTLAESSPDSSPTISGRGITIPQRRGTLAPWINSPGMSFGQQFPASGTGDRATISSSVSSVNMLDSDTSSSEEDYDEPMNGDKDEMMNSITPQANKVGGILANPFTATQGLGNDWIGTYSPTPSNLIRFQRARFRGRRSRHSSSSASGNSSKPSPGPLSPPVLKSIESSGGGYFSRDMSKSAVQSRRESLSLGTRDLHLSDFSDDGENRATRRSSPTSQSNPEGGPRGVIRRVVTRRGNLLPKTKNFARIRAALIEESAPLDSEAKREAEVVRLVRESDSTVQSKSPVFPLKTLPTVNTMAPCKSMLGAKDAPTKIDEVIIDSSFSNQVSRNSGGMRYWDSFDENYRTPPPVARVGGMATASGEDASMDSSQSIDPAPTISDLATPLNQATSRSPILSATNLSLATGFRRKRRRDDDLDPDSFKRRAVSPGMSVQSSPILSQPPMVKDCNSRGLLPKSTPGSFALEREANSSGSSNGPAGSIKRVGLQGMNETNDGLMNMSIE